MSSTDPAHARRPDPPPVALPATLIVLALAVVLGVTAARPARVATLPLVRTQRLVNVNAAGPAELSLLPLVGPGLARHIVDHRAAHGPFETVAQLDDVHRIGPKTLANFAPFVECGEAAEDE